MIYCLSTSYCILLLRYTKHLDAELALPGMQITLTAFCTLDYLENFGIAVSMTASLLIYICTT